VIYDRQKLVHGRDTSICGLEHSSVRDVKELVSTFFQNLGIDWTFPKHLLYKYWCFLER